MIGAASMDSDRKLELLGRGVDRPEDPPPEQYFAHHEKQHLDEAPIGSDALDLGDGGFGIVERHDDGGAQARLAVEQLLRHPVVHRAAQRSEEHTSELQSLRHLVCRLLLEKKKKKNIT